MGNEPGYILRFRGVYYNTPLRSVLPSSTRCHVMAHSPLLKMRLDILHHIVFLTNEDVLMSSSSQSCLLKYRSLITMPALVLVVLTGQTSTISILLVGRGSATFHVSIETWFRMRKPLRLDQLGLSNIIAIPSLKHRSKKPNFSSPHSAYRR